mmetsp:Transcript_9724/g.23744  ORF Transcript_9724/g.23744 Transcript_9724/m.23744 type:complete len:304 (+) Transcript_9724:814-1725(+)
MPAFAIEMVCCSIASWMATWSLGSILSNSSMQHTPLSAIMRAPGSITVSPASLSRWTEAVSPAAVDALPDEYTARVCSAATHLRNWLLAVEGSPTKHTLMSPRSFMPLLVHFSIPPTSMTRMPFLTWGCPYTAGAMDLAMRSKQSLSRPTSLIFSCISTDTPSKGSSWSLLSARAPLPALSRAYSSLTSALVCPLASTVRSSLQTSDAMKPRSYFRSRTPISLSPWMASAAEPVSVVARRFSSRLAALGTSVCFMSTATSGSTMKVPVMRHRSPGLTMPVMSPLRKTSMPLGIEPRGTSVASS